MPSITQNIQLLKFYILSDFFHETCILICMHTYARIIYNMCIYVCVCIMNLYALFLHLYMALHTFRT